MISPETWAIATRVGSCPPTAPLEYCVVTREKAIVDGMTATRRGAIAATTRPDVNGYLNVRVVVPAPVDIIEKIDRWLRHFLIAAAAWFAGMLTVQVTTFASVGFVACTAASLLAERQRRRLAAERRASPRLVPLIDLIPTVNIPGGFYGHVLLDDQTRALLRLPDGVPTWSVRPGHNVHAEIWLHADTQIGQQ
jgi:hypothetical protein